MEDVRQRRFSETSRIKGSNFDLSDDLFAQLLKQSHSSGDSNRLRSSSRGSADLEDFSAQVSDLERTKRLVNDLKVGMKRLDLRCKGQDVTASRDFQSQLLRKRRLCIRTIFTLTQFLTNAELKPTYNFRLTSCRETAPHKASPFPIASR